MKIPKLEITVAEMAVTMRGMAADIGQIKTRLDVMDENFARKQDVDKNSASIVDLRNSVQTLEVRMAVTKSELRTWGIIGGIIITLVSAAISALQIHL